MINPVHADSEWKVDLNCKEWVNREVGSIITSEKWGESIWLGDNLHAAEEETLQPDGAGCDVGALIEQLFQGKRRGGEPDPLGWCHPGSVLVAEVVPGPVDIQQRQQSRRTEFTSWLIHQL